MKIGIWATAVNGKGSAIVSSGLILSLLDKLNQNEFNEIYIYLTKDTTLDKRISKNLKDQKGRIFKLIYLHNFLNNYFFQAIVRLFFCPNVKLLYVFDDYPLLLHRKQILFLQQALLLKKIKKLSFSDFNLWLKQKLFGILLFNSGIILTCQTRHMRNLLLKKYGKNSFVLRHGPFY